MSFFILANSHWRLLNRRLFQSAYLMIIRWVKEKHQTSTHPQPFTLNHPPQTVSHYGGVSQTPNRRIIGSIPVIKVDNAPLQQVIEEGVILLFVPTSVVLVEILIGHQGLMPKLIVQAEMLEPLVTITVEVELVNDLKGTRLVVPKDP